MRSLLLEAGDTITLDSALALKVIEVTDAQILLERPRDLSMAVPREIWTDDEFYLALTYTSGRRYLYKIHESKPPDPDPADLARAFIVRD